MTYTPLGAGMRLVGGWRVTGVNLPVHPNLTLRMRGYYATGWANGSGSMSEWIVPAADFNVIKNGDFTLGLSGWLFFATPDMSYIVSNVTGGALQFYRLPPPPGTTNQAVAFQQTGIGLNPNVPLVAQFDLGNNSSVRKRVSILLHDSDFSDLSVCTFWLPANAPLTTYGMTTHTTKAWANPTISFYAASAGSNGGFYQIDNVSVQYAPAARRSETWCDDALAPGPPGGPDSADLLVNGDFGIGHGRAGLESLRQHQRRRDGRRVRVQQDDGRRARGRAHPAHRAGHDGQPAPHGHVPARQQQRGAQAGHRAPARQQLQRPVGVHVLARARPGPGDLHLPDVCHAAWANATLSVYPATVGAEQWIRLDNVTFKRTPSAVVGGTECFEPGSSPGASVLVPTWGASAPTAAPLRGGQGLEPLADPARAEARALHQTRQRSGPTTGSRTASSEPATRAPDSDAELGRRGHRGRARTRSNARRRLI